MTSTIDWSFDDVALTKQLLALSKPKLIKICKSKQVSSHGNKKEVIDRLIQKNKQQMGKGKKKKKKSKKKKKQNHNKQISTKSLPTISNINNYKLPNKLPKINHELSISVDLSQTETTPVPDICELTFDIDQKEIEISELKENTNKYSKPFFVKIDKMKTHGKKGSYIWILDKNRKLRSIPSPIPISSIQKNRKLSLTNSHNFLWITSILQGSISFAQKESELNRGCFDRMLSLLPKNYRISLWNVINIDNDTFIVSEEYIEFVDCLLIATGQKYGMEHDMDLEIRDMSKIFAKIVNIDAIFKDLDGKYTTNTVSKSKKALSVNGATKIICNLRNMDENENNISIQNDLALPILTGLTKKALMYSVTYCTQSYWKILTGVFWDEENEDDLALCTPISHFNSVVKNTSMQDLFGDLFCEMSYDLKQITEDVINEVQDEQVNYLNV